MNDQSQYPRRGDVNMRDEFAMAALPTVERLRWPWKGTPTDEEIAEWIAVHAYRVADAMLLQRDVPHLTTP